MLLRNSSLPPRKPRSLNTATRALPKSCTEEISSPKFPGRLGSRSPHVTQKRSPRKPASLKKHAPARGIGRSFQDLSHLGLSRYTQGFCCANPIEILHRRPITAEIRFICIFPVYQKPIILFDRSRRRQRAEPFCPPELVRFELVEASTQRRWKGHPTRHALRCASGFRPAAAW